MNTMLAPKSRYVRPRKSQAVIEMAQAQRDSILDDPRAAFLSRWEYLLLQQLLYWHDPMTGRLYSRTPVRNLEKKLQVSDTTIMRARRGLIAKGLILGYVPGRGMPGEMAVASTYHVARSWAEADQGAALRQLPDAPYFPELPPDMPSRPGELLAAPAAPEVDEGQEQEEPEAAEAAAPVSDPPRGPGRPRRGARAPKEPLWTGPEKGLDPQVAESLERRRNRSEQGELRRSAIAELRASKGWRQPFPTEVS